MDNFRWILLGVGILFVVIVYLISRKNRRDFYQGDDTMPDELPELNTSNWDDLDEGVGEGRGVARANDDESILDKTRTSESYGDDLDDEASDPLFASKHQYRSVATAEAESTYQATEPEYRAEPEPEPEHEPRIESEEAAEEVKEQPSETVLVLNILARDGSSLAGKSINSVAQANDMVFGDMNIYHHMDENDNSVFSMINMVKPGSFDPATIHDLNTPGVSPFLQLPGPFNAGDAFNDMLQTAYRMSDMLEARLCDRSRQPLTESVVEEYRSIAASFDGKH